MMTYGGLQLGSALLLVSLGVGCTGDDVVDSTGGDSGRSGGGGEDATAGADATAAADAPSADKTSPDATAAVGDGGSASADANDADAANTSDGGTLHPAHAAVDLGMAGQYAILAMSAISTVPTSAVTGNIGVSPAAATFITGFTLTADATNVFATSTQVTGKVFAADYAVPTPSNLTTAIGDMQSAFTDAAGRAPDVTELGAGNIGGKTLTAGVYKWGTGLLIPTNVTLTGNATDVWIFQIAQNLTMSSAVSVVLTGGALPANVFWEVAGDVDVGTTAHLAGAVLCKTAIALRTGASIDGRLLAQTMVSIDDGAVVAP
jgi:hypothetical protein